MIFSEKLNKNGEEWKKAKQDGRRGLFSDLSPCRNINLNNYPCAKISSQELKESRRESTAPKWNTEIRKDALKKV
mgnify:CR=1 FL=1